MIRAVLVILIISCLFENAWCNTDYGFGSPVTHKLRISGSFAEYRTNHYHSGIDIKSSKGVIGDPLLAVQSGYVSRIKIQSGGYGNVLFITHPNGFTSVYAHMEKFLPEIQAYVKKMQYELQCFEVESYLPKDMFVIAKGQQIGLMGTTGRSTGPHLHFELRDSQTEEPVNPYLYGIAPGDNSEPVAQQLAVYDMEYPHQAELIGLFPFKKDSDGICYLDLLEVNARNIGLGIQMFDRMDGALNKNEVYKCTMLAADSLSFAWQADRFAFDEARQIHARLDFTRRKSSKQNIQLLFSQTCGSLSFLDDSKWNGIIPLFADSIVDIQLDLSDVAGNKLHCKMSFKGTSNNSKEKYHQHLDDVHCDTDTTLYYEGITVQLPAKTLFSKSHMNLSWSNMDIGGQIVDAAVIGDEDIPVAKYFKVALKVEDKAGLSLVKRNRKGRLCTYGAHSNSGFLTTLLNEFGSFGLYQDLEKPTITTIRFSANPQKYDEWRFTITDNLEPAGILDDLIYNAYLDGQWVRLLYDKKNDLLRFVDLELIKDSSKEFKIIVSDNAGNIAERAYSLNISN